MTKKFWRITILAAAAGTALLVLAILGMPSGGQDDQILPTLMVLPTLTPADAGADSSNASATADIPAGEPSVQPAGMFQAAHTAPLPTAEVARQNAPTQPVPAQIVLRFASSASPQDRADYIQQFGGTVSKQIDALDAVVVKLPPGGVVPPSTALVQSSEPDYFVMALQDSAVNDPLYPQQWALPVIAAPGAWSQIPADAPQVIVAVIDSGICAEHPDLAGRIVVGYDFVDGDSVPQDDLGHGCGVSGIIAANSNNAIGMAGIAPNVSIMPLRVLNAQGLGTYSDVASALVYAADHGAQIANLSLGGAYPSSVLEDAVNYAVSHGVMVVAAAGNTGSSVLYPAAYAPVIAVASVDSDLQRSSFSSYGPEVDALAPGRDILTTRRDGDYGTMSGTSFAAPQVVGVAALDMALGQNLVLDGGIVHVSGQTTAVVLPPTPDAVLTPATGADELPLTMTGLIQKRPASLANIPAGLGTELAELYTQWPTDPQQAAQAAEARGVKVLGDKVAVMLIMQDEAAGESAIESIMALGGDVTAHFETWIDANVPITTLLQLAQIPGVSLVRSQIEVVPADDEPPEGDVTGQVGPNTTQGVVASNADQWHIRGYTGQGAHVAILDAGFKDYTTAQSMGELPQSMSIQGTLGTSTRHGTAVAEIIHDMAPDAHLTLATPTTATSMAQLISGLGSSNDVISSSIGYCFAESGDGTGVLSNAVTSAYNHGAIYVQAAGNYATSHWDGSFVNSDQDSWLEFESGVEINWLSPMPVGSVINLGLRWNSWPTTNQDYDLYLVGYDGSQIDTIAGSFIGQNGSSEPVEYLSYVTSSQYSDYGVAIQKYSANGSAVFDLIGCSGGDFTFDVTARSLFDPASGIRAFSVAALDATSPFPLEYYSSRGPTYGPGGGLNGGLDKPRIAGFANVDTWSYGSGIFNGTSSATPHVSGAAALVASAYPGYSPGQIMSFLESRAVDMGTAGYDYVYGMGRLYLGDIAAQIPGKPGSLMPVKGFLTNDPTPDLTWGAVVGAVDYQLQLDNNSDFSSPEADDIVTSTSFTPSSDLTDNRYYWRVRARNMDGDAGLWSSVWYFTLDTVAPDIPVLSSPVDGFVTTSSRPVLRWGAAAGAYSYEVQLDLTNPPGAIVSETRGRSYSPPGPLMAGMYFWRVRAKDGAGNVSDWSDIYSMVVDSAAENRADTQSLHHPHADLNLEPGKLGDRLRNLGG